MNRNKRVTIVTGPPGAGKTTFVATNFPNLPIYDSDLGNKSLWRDCPSNCVLITAAPTADNKQFWLEECSKYGFADPVLYVIDPGRATAVQRMLDRPGVLPTQHNRLSKTVQRWYRRYSPHPDEKRIDETVRQAASAG